MHKAAFRYWWMASGGILTCGATWLSHLNMTRLRPSEMALARVRSGAQTLYIDSRGAVVLSTRLLAGEFRDAPLAPAQVGEKWGYMDKKGNIVITPRYEVAGPFAEGLAAVKTDGKASFIRPDGKIAFSTDADIVNEFSDGFTRVRAQNGMWNFLDSRRPGL